MEWNKKFKKMQKRRLLWFAYILRHEETPSVIFKEREEEVDRGQHL